MGEANFYYFTCLKFKILSSDFEKKMGAYKYVNELWRKKQTDVMGFLLRVRTWQYRQLARAQGFSTDSHRKGSQTGISREARIRHLPRPRSPWIPQEARRQGMHLRQTDPSRHQSNEIPAIASIHRRGACRSQDWFSARSQLLLGRRGFHLQILRSHHGRSRPHRHPQRSSHPMDLRSETEAPRIAWKDCCWQDVAWIGKRSSLFRHQGRFSSRSLAQKEHPFPHPLPSLSHFQVKRPSRKESANYDLSPCLWTICFLFCDFNVISSRVPYYSLTIIIFVSTRIKQFLKFMHLIEGFKKISF